MNDRHFDDACDGACTARRPGRAARASRARSMGSMGGGIGAQRAGRVRRAMPVALLLAGCASHGVFQPRPVLSQRGTVGDGDLSVAESALAAGDAELAATLFERALKADPRSLPAQVGLGDAMYQTGELARAGVLYAQAAAAAPDDPRAQLGLARVALRERHLDDALARYAKLNAARPDNIAAAAGLGTVLDLLGRHDDAQRVYRAALARHPDAHALKTDLGLSLVLADRAREGANVLLDIAGLPNAPAQAREDLALAYGMLGNDDAAKRILVHDLPAASAEDNLRFYRNVRARRAARGGSGGRRRTG
ncbi:tetratricopeptide repeat protein, partial [Burkholderia mallei]|uniref:tetratricopeptide repeat protein n=2 Tax=Burkholderia mallei TaxID=13373 RepID=UPI000EA8C3D5